MARLAEERFVLRRGGVHGPAHWQRVRENGLRLAHLNGADAELVELFALLHDCCRESDSSDPEHGPRAAAWMEPLRDELFGPLGHRRFVLLQEAVRDHTSGHHHRNVTVGSCWDADRLDIGRVGIRPLRRFLSTREARDPRVLQWAYQRSRGGKK